ncbi:hypothetical protein [Streptomyces sp. NPDC050485]|uniref:hypothetical protein n=1 Tax=Streptomyces sp. NPDC050485 TaxID=3365617 RepID=UPI0037A83A24
MGRPAILSVRITADARRAQQGAQTAQRAFDKLSSTIKGMAVTAAAAAGLGGIAAFATKAVKSASEVEQNFGALDAVFKGSSEQMKRWAADAAQAAGLSKESYSGMAVILGASLKNQGVALGDVGKLTNSLITKGADLASMFGGTTQEAVEALTAAFRGEADPAERYGLNLSQTAVQAYKAAHATQNLTDTQARLALITEQSKDSTGNFAKEADTLQGQVQRLSAQWDNMVAALGTKVLPYLTQAATVVNANVLPAIGALASTIGSQLGPTLLALGSWIGTNVVPVLQTLGAFLITNVLPVLGTLAATILTVVIPAIASFVQWIAQTVSDWAPLIAAIGVAAAILAGPYLAAVVAANVRGLVWMATMGAQTVAMNATRIATTVWTAAQWLLNAAMSANPIGLVIALVAGLATGVYLAYQRSSTFRGIVQAVWAQLKTLGGYVGGAFKSIWNGLVSGFNAVKDAIGWVIDKVSSLINWLGKIKMPKVLSDIGGAIGGLLSSPAPKQANTLRSAGRNAEWLGGPRNAPTRGRTALSLNPQFHLMVSIDGQQLQGRIHRTVNRALLEDGARLAAGGWA